MSEITIAPARIAIQVRDGAWNDLISFDLTLHNSRPISADEAKISADAHLEHDIDVLDIVKALAQAQRPLIERVRAEGTEEVVVNTNKWLRQLVEWVIA